MLKYVLLFDWLKCKQLKTEFLLLNPSPYFEQKFLFKKFKFIRLKEIINKTKLSKQRTRDSLRIMDLIEIEIKQIDATNASKAQENEFTETKKSEFWENTLEGVTTFTEPFYQRDIQVMQNIVESRITNLHKRSKFFLKTYSYFFISFFC